MSKVPMTDAEIDAYGESYAARAAHCLSSVGPCGETVCDVCRTSSKNYAMNEARKWLGAAQPFINRVRREMEAEHDTRVTELLQANNREVERRRALAAEVRRLKGE